MSDALIYPERVNALNGESGSGKSWVALQTAAETIQTGGHVIYIDLEDHATNIVARLLALGATRDELRRGLTYIRPEARLGPDAETHLRRIIEARGTTLVVIDSIGELMALEGCKPNDDDAVATLYRRIPRMIARLGPAVLVIDHVPKDNERSPLYGIGSQRKRAAIDGASYMVEQVKAFSADRDGKIKLITAKDRNGNFATGTVAAEINVHAEEGDRLRLEVKAPKVSQIGGRWVPTGIMEKVSRLLEDGPEMTHNTIKMSVRANDGNHLKIALAELVEGGYITRRDGPRNSHNYTSIRPYREIDTLIPNPTEDTED
jgi:hypothetical protein